MQEYYIRKEGDEDSRGPFTLEQLSSLVEAGQVDRQTYYYDALSEKWMEVQSNADLVAALFPMKKRLTMRPKEEVDTVNIPATKDEQPITVEEMLAAAEGRTDDSKHRRDTTDRDARAALWGLRIMAVLLLVSSAGLLISDMQALSSGEFFAVVGSPFVIFGCVDLLLAVFLFLEVTSVYSLARSRAAIGVGFFAIYFLSIGEWIPFVAVAVGSAAIFLCTVLLNFWAVLVTGILGLAGMGAFAYFFLS
jgi:hypothetical protein